MKKKKVLRKSIKPNEPDIEEEVEELGDSHTIEAYEAIDSHATVKKE